jgi:hypothetical protein
MFVRIGTKSTSSNLPNQGPNRETHHYHVKLGARSLMAGAEKVKRIVLEVYLNDDEEITEREGLRDFVVDVDDGEIVGKLLTDAPAKNHTQL